MGALAAQSYSTAIQDSGPILFVTTVGDQPSQKISVRPQTGLLIGPLGHPVPILYFLHSQSYIIFTFNGTPIQSTITPPSIFGPRTNPPTTSIFFFISLVLGL